MHPMLFRKLIGPTRKNLFFTPTNPTNARRFISTTSTHIPAITRLPLLDLIVECASKVNNKPNFSRVAIVANQHILETTATLVKAWIQLGVNPANIHLAGKFYSTSPVVHRQMQNLFINIMPNSKPQQIGQYAEHVKMVNSQLWESCLENLEKTKHIDTVVVIDDGFRCVENMPPIIATKYKMAFLEQTRAGFYSPYVGKFSFPHIAVALSAAKKLLESPQIATATLKHIEKISASCLRKDTGDLVCGVIGNGAIGNALVKSLLSKGLKVHVYDEDPKSFKNINSDKFFRLDSIIDVINSAEYIFGCSGKDVTEGLDLLERLIGIKTFISCSSENREFSELITKIANELYKHPHFLLTDPTQNIHFNNHDRGIIHLLNGGFPINFDREIWNVPAEDIALTQGLMLIGTIQAISQAKKLINDGKTINRAEIQQLDPIAQRFVVDAWRKMKKIDIEKVWKCITWIKKHSEGKYHKNDFLMSCFSNLRNIDDFFEMPDRPLRGIQKNKPR